jgi:predicted phosphodiesterase
MRYAILSDIHSNLEALNAVLRKIDSQKVDEIISIGDVVGYNANPNECIDILRRRGIRSLMGNHDMRACGMESAYDFNPIAKDAIVWTKETLSKENLDFLKSQPRTLYLNEKRAIAIHGSFTSHDIYILSALNAQENFKIMEESHQPHLCFFGHTHVKIIYAAANSDVTTSFDDELDISESERYLINPGSVGQPRDMNPNASFLIYDTKTKKVQFYKVQYDVSVSAQKILKAGLPIELAERLEVGW